MNQATLDFIHQSYQEALMKSGNVLEIVENLYQILSEAEVAEEDTVRYDSFVDGLRGCIEYRRKTFVLTNTITYINITFLYIVLWLNSTQGLKIDIDLYARRKSLESDLAKVLRKSKSDLSATIRDRFGVRGILLNDLPKEKAEQYIYTIYETFLGIIAAKNRKMRKEFIEWFENNNQIPLLDKATVQHVLEIPFSVDFVKDFIKSPKSNGYQSLQFTLSIQMYSQVLPGFQMEVQLRSKAMHIVAEHGTASHDGYKDGDFDEDEEEERKLAKEVFVVDDFSKLHIIGFTSYNSKEDDADGIHFAKEFSNRRISTTLV